MASNESLSRNLLITSVTTIVAYFVFYVTKVGIESTVYGTLTIKVSGSLFIIPTSILTSTLIGALIYGIMSSFLRGVADPESADRKTRISKKLIVAALTVITMYAAFNLQEEVLKASQYGTINYNIAPGMTFVIPSVVLITVVLTFLVFLILVEFASNVSKDIAVRHSSGIRRLSSAVFSGETKSDS